MPNTEICVCHTCHHIVNENYGAGNVNSWQQICYLLGLQINRLNVTINAIND